MIDRLVINGCSYMNYYHKGGGTADLSDKLNLNEQVSYAENSVCNNRILRTTLRDMYSTKVPTLYIIGTTFLTRYELALLTDRGADGCWVSFNGCVIDKIPNEYKKETTLLDLNNYAKSYVNLMNGKDLLEDLMYRLLSLKDTATQLGHKILIFNTAEHAVTYYINEPQFDLFRQHKEIIGGFVWRSIPWQFEQGATYPQEDEQYPADCRHVTPGDHSWLNDFLTNYIHEHKILQ